MSLEDRESLKEREKGHGRYTGILELAILVALPVLFHYLIPLMIVISPPYSFMGAIVMLLGLGLMIWTAEVFRNAGTGFQLREGGSSLVTTGPFRFSRNPMYLGMLIWLTGLAILLGSCVVFIFPIIFFLLAHFFLIPMEERKMEQISGQQFVEYRQRTRRWL
jgi:protein-S-isoprenylcysteine O-methyltransferase Ste14